MAFLAPFRKVVGKIVVAAGGAIGGDEGELAPDEQEALLRDAALVALLRNPSHSSGRYVADVGVGTFAAGSMFARQQQRQARERGQSPGARAAAVSDTDDDAAQSLVQRVIRDLTAARRRDWNGVVRSDGLCCDNSAGGGASLSGRCAGCAACPQCTQALANAGGLVSVEGRLSAGVPLELSIGNGGRFGRDGPGGPPEPLLAQLRRLPERAANVVGEAAYTAHLVTTPDDEVGCSPYFLRLASETAAAVADACRQSALSSAGPSRAAPLPPGLAGSVADDLVERASRLLEGEPIASGARASGGLLADDDIDLLNEVVVVHVEKLVERAQEGQAS